MTYPNLLQFPESAPELPKNLPQAIRGNYLELSRQLDIQMKQKKLADETCYPWEIACDPPRGLKALVSSSSPMLTRRKKGGTETVAESPYQIR
jgi:hypothetical protein